MWDLSCRDWETRVREGRSLVPDLPLFKDEAEIAVAFFKKLRLPDVPNMPTMEEACGPWFIDIVAALFGSRDPKANVRHIEEIFALIAKKNSKTTYGAALMLTALFMNVRRRAAFLFVGPTQAIADLAFEQASGMIEADPDGELQKRFKATEHNKTIKDLVTGAKLKVKTFDLKILTGQKPAGVLLDELHLLGKVPFASKVIRQIRGGRHAVPEGFLVITTTQSDDVPSGAFLEELRTARAIRDGKAKGKMLPVLYEFPEEIAKNRDRWGEYGLWPMVMPNLNRSLRLETLIPDWETEQEKGEQAIRVWASQHLNIQVGLGLSGDTWAGAEFWEGAAEEALSLDDLIERCEVIVFGIDGGGLDDLLGLAALGREKETRRWLLWTHAWAHRIVLQRRKEIAPRLLDFEEDGDLTIVERPGDDVAAVADLVCQVRDAGLLPEKNAIGVDAVGIGDIVDELTAPERGITSEQIVGISQGWKLNAAIKTAGRKLAGGEMVHGGQPLMAWCVGNAKVELRGSAESITKQTAGSAKIDPLMGVFDAVSLMAMNPSAARSIYEERGLRVA